MLPAIWRKLRTEFALLLNLKFHYENQFTKLISKFYKYRGISVFKTAELKIDLILVRARFTLTLENSREMLDAS
jgi:hypothetical protein